MIKEKRKRQAKRKQILIAVLTILCLTGILALIAIKGFTLQKVIVSGNELYSDEKIKESVLNDEYSWNTLYVMLKYRLSKMEEMPFVDEMELSLRSPHTLQIKVYEKAIIGCMKGNGQNVYFDKDGLVVEISERLIENVPKVEGITCKKMIVYEKLKLDNNDALSLLLMFSRQLQKYGLSPETITFGTDGNLSAAFGDITASIGDAQYLVEKAMRLDAILPQLDGKKGTLHLETWTPLNTDVTFRPVKK